MKNNNHAKFGKLNIRYRAIWLFVAVAAVSLIAACADVTGFYGRMLHTGADNSEPPFTLVLYLSADLDSRDSVSFRDGDERLRTTGFSGDTVHIYYWLANPEDVAISELYLEFLGRNETITHTTHSSPFPYTVNPLDADEHGYITIVASSIHTNRAPLDYPTSVTFYQSGLIRFAPGANNAAADATFTYTLYRNLDPVYGFVDRPIVSDLLAPGLVDEMLSEDGAYMVRVTARSANNGFESSSLPSVRSAEVNVHAVTVEITGNGTVAVSVDGEVRLPVFPVFVFHGSTVRLTATPEGYRYAIWNGEDEGAVRVIEGIRNKLTVTLEFADLHPEITIDQQPAWVTVRFGNITERLEVAATVSGGRTILYQWYSNTTNSTTGGYSRIVNATSASFAIPQYLGEGALYFFVRLSIEGEEGTVTSNVARVYVTALIPLNPPTNVTLAQNGLISFIPGDNNAEAGVSSFSFTLYRNDEIVPAFVDQPAPNGFLVYGLTDEMLNAAGEYTVSVVANTNNPNFTSVSDAAVSNFVDVFAVNVTIVSDNIADTVSVGGQSYTANFTTRAFDGTTVTLTAVPAGSRLAAWSGAGSGTGNTRTITGISVNVGLTVTFVDPVITFTTQPLLETTVVFGEISGSLSVAATVSGIGSPDFQWFSNTMNSNVGGSPVSPEVTSASFAIPTNLAAGRHYFFAEATVDGATPVRSTVAVVTVVTPVVTINTQPATVTSLFAGNVSGSLAVAASVTEGATLSYRWYHNITNDYVTATFTGATSASFTIPTDLAVGMRFFFVEVSATGGAAPVLSNFAVVTVFALPTSPVSIEMIPVGGGSFELGRELGTIGEDVTPVFPRTISDFSLGRYQVTREQWITVMTGNPNGISPTNPGWSDAAANAQETAAGFNVNRRPVTHVSWYDAIVFSNLLSIRNGLTPAYKLPNQWPDPTFWTTDPDTWGTVPTAPNDPLRPRWDDVRVVPGSTGYRLPTDAQWEFAAKGGNAPGLYSFAGSNTATAVGWVADNSGGSPRMVGLLPANGLGLHDMSGNVWEWVWDWVGPATAEPSTDPVGPSSGSFRRGRGGGWGGYYVISAPFARSVIRGGSGPAGRWDRSGLRVARP